MDTDRIFVDACVIANYCIARDTRLTGNFFEYLKKHRIGSVTQEIKNIAENTIRKASSKISFRSHYRDMF